MVNIVGDKCEPIHRNRFASDGEFTWIKNEHKGTDGRHPSDWRHYALNGLADLFMLWPRVVGVDNRLAALLAFKQVHTGFTWEAAVIRVATDRRFIDGVHIGVANFDIPVDPVPLIASGVDEGGAQRW